MEHQASDDLDEVLEAMSVAQQDLVDALARAVDLAPKAKAVVSDLTAEMEGAPLETILREMLAAREQATADRVQVARLVVLLERLKTTTDANASRLERLENAGVNVAANLAAQQERADAVSGAPGAAADAGMRSPQE